MVFEGKSFGATGTVLGEIVFTTGCCGFVETLTDPSYYGQIVTQTFPLVGNYGFTRADAESEKCWLSGYIVREWCELPSNFRSEGTIDEFLKENHVVAIYDIDTRKLTKTIRESGVMNGAIICGDYDREEMLEKIRAYRIKDAVKTVSIKEPKVYPAQGEARCRVALLDFGYKHAIRRELCKRGCEVTVLPHNTTAREIQALGVDGVMLTNGPGDPTENGEVIQNLREIFTLGMPVFGICLGHQLTALANGAKTRKMKYGHRGANQPVVDLKHDRTFVTSQNHGYAVLGDSIDPAVGTVSHVNANDGSCEGVRYQNMPVFTVQFHPEACGGPLDTMYLFDEFIAMMSGEEQ